MQNAKRWVSLMAAVLIVCAAMAPSALAKTATPAPAPAQGTAAPGGKATPSPKPTKAPTKSPASAPTAKATAPAATVGPSTAPEGTAATQVSDATQAPVTPVPTGALATGGPVDVRFVSAYQRAEQPGMYIAITPKGDAYNRVRKKLKSLIDGSAQKLGGDQANVAAEAVIKEFLSTTKSNLDLLYQAARGSADSKGAVVQIEDSYVKAYDFIPIADAQGRQMLYPVMEYDVDLYSQLLGDARPKVAEQALDLINRAFSAVTNGMDKGTARDALTVQFQKQIAGFSLSDAEIGRIFDAAESAQFGEGITLKEAVDASSDLTIGGLGDAVPLRVAQGDAALYAAYELRPTSDGGGMSGEPLAAVVAKDQMLADTEQSGKLYLNAAGELVYVRPLQSWLSADAAKLTQLLVERGGQVTATPAPEQEARHPSAVLWYVLGGAGLIALALAIAYFVLRARVRGNHRR